MGSVIVTGGAGYIGSHIVRHLHEKGRRVVVLDNLSEGHADAVPAEVPLIRADFGDREVLDEQFGSGEVDYVIHMAASCQVGESVADPAPYYENNVSRSLCLLDAVRRHGLKGMVFSSTAAVYGDPQTIPMPEDHPVAPTNTYGETKLAFERALAWHERAYGTRYVALRYFNAAGAHPDGTIGEDHDPETHLIPRLIKDAVRGGAKTPIFGDDYPTSDGTCVRDYVHVMDLAEAHVLALNAMERGIVRGDAFNLGNGEGFSVREVIEMVGRVSGTSPQTEVAPRRPGDPAILIASSARAREILGWQPKFPELSAIIESAWRWHRSRPTGYGDG